MGRVTLNLDGGGFYGDRSSCHGKRSQLVQWNRLLRAAVPTVHIDWAALESWLPGPAPHWAWMLETPATTDRIAALLPLYKFQYVFTHSTVLAQKVPGVRWAPASGIWIHAPRVRAKTRLVSMITSPKASLDGHRARLQIARRLHSAVDVFGLNGRIPFKEMGLNDYMFSVAVENAQSPGYFTEKLLDCFATGTVPIYKGAPDIDTFFNPAGIITLTDGFDPVTLSADLYHSMLPAIQDNFERCLQYEIPEDYIARRYLL